MKKVYTKPNMEIVSLATENIATGATTSIIVETANNGVQNSFKTISYY